MKSPGALGVGIGLGTLGAISATVAIAFIAKSSGGMDGGFFNYASVGYAMLAPSALLLGGGVALVVFGVRPVMRERPSSSDRAVLRLHLSPLGGVFGTF